MCSCAKLTVFISAVISTFMFAEIYTFLTNVDLIKVTPDSDSGFYVNGIMCTMAKESDYDYCDNMARMMAYAAEIKHFDIISEPITTIAPTATTTMPTLAPTIAPTIDNSSICISGSSRTEINGKYEYSSWNFEFNGPIYNNSQNDLYLYPYITSSDHKKYAIGTNTSHYYRIGHYYCKIPSSSNPMTPLDCYNGNGQQFRTYNGSAWGDDKSAVLTLCESKSPTTAPHTQTPTRAPHTPTKSPILSAKLTYGSLCFIGAKNTTYDGTYQFSKTSTNISGLIWKHYQYDIYLYPFGDEFIQWKVSDLYNMTNTTLLCDASATTDGYYAILDEGCYNWQEYVDSGWVENDEITILPGECGSVMPSHDWDCSKFTNYQNPKKIWNRFKSFYYYLVFLITFAVLYGLVCLIHDWTLMDWIHDETNLLDVSFLPVSDEEFIFSYFMLRGINNCMKGGNRCCCLICYVPIALFLSLVVCIELLMVPFCYVFASCFCCNLCNGLKSASASCVGLLRLLMCFSTMALLYHITYGFNFSIESVNANDKCECSCNYVFYESDYRTFCLVTVLFFGSSALFLWTWVKEANSGNHFLYLITYELPIEYAHRINPDNCAGDMIEMELLLPQLQNETEQKKKDETEQMPVVTGNESQPGAGRATGAADDVGTQQEEKKEEDVDPNALAWEHIIHDVGIDVDNGKCGFVYRLLLLSLL
eukprot:231910_1